MHIKNPLQKATNIKYNTVIPTTHYNKANENSSKRYYAAKPPKIKVKSKIIGSQSIHSKSLSSAHSYTFYLKVKGILLFSLLFGSLTFSCNSCNSASYLYSS